MARTIIARRKMNDTEPRAMMRMRVKSSEFSFALDEPRSPL
uniref:Uncharacterized protein n=1 Tax=Anguilla anguilla TaxID=7936 RepID=A0A0E9SDN5_ANGAN